MDLETQAIAKPYPKLRLADSRHHQATVVIDAPRSERKRVLIVGGGFCRGRVDRPPRPPHSPELCRRRQLDERLTGAVARGGQPMDLQGPAGAGYRVGSLNERRI